MKIDKNIPIPSIKMPGACGGLTAVLRSMAEGDSIVIPSKKRNGACSSARSARIKITTRKINKTEHRVWVIRKEVMP